jgi:hypothetical protein
MGIPGNSHETAIFELGIPIGIPQISTPGIPASGIPGPYWSLIQVLFPVSDFSEKFVECVLVR